jgi:hypothetical protein
MTRLRGAPRESKHSSIAVLNQFDNCMTKTVRRCLCLCLRLRRDKSKSSQRPVPWRLQLAKAIEGGDSRQVESLLASGKRFNRPPSSKLQACLPRTALALILRLPNEHEHAIQAGKSIESCRISNTTRLVQNCSGKIH